jgi:FkbM family methyltransferase
MEMEYAVNGRCLRFFGDTERDLHRYCDEVIGAREYDALLQGLGASLCVVDLGACLGTFSAWIYDRARVIYAVEPAVKNYANLTKMVEGNGLDKIWMYNFAVGAGVPGFRMLHENGDCGSYTLAERDPDVYEWVYTTTLERFLEMVDPDPRVKIDVLKVDVEGAETEIFSSPAFADVVPRLPYIIGEAHNGDEVSRLLMPHGYTVDYLRSPTGSTLFAAKRNKWLL